MNNLPSSWAIAKLGDVCEFQYGKGLTKANQTENGKYPVYGSNGIVGYHDKYLMEEPCLIVGRKGAAGEVHITKTPSWPIDTTYFVRTKELNLSFFYYLLKTLKLNELDKSTAIPGLNRNDAYKKEVFLPPLPEQHRIVSKLEELFSELDIAVESLKKAKEQIKTYKQSVLSSILNSELRILNEGWKKYTFLELVDVKSGKGLTSSKMIENGKYPVYGGNDINGYYNNYMYEEQRLIIGRVGAKCGVVHITKPKSWITDNALIVDYDKELVSMKFLYWLFTFKDLNKYSVSTAQPVISKTSLKYSEFSIPNSELQSKIVAEIESRFSEAENLEKTIDLGLEQAESLRQSILKKAFEGRLVPQDPNDEPASLLLERIKQEKLKINNGKLRIKKGKK